MSIPQILADLRGDLHFMANVVTWRTLEAQPARLASIPPTLHPLLHRVLQQRNIQQLYSHQAQAVDLALTGHNLVIVTPTASGKTFCYNLPVLHSLLSEPAARALYLFPTKALAQDQLAELHTLTTQITAPSANQPIHQSQIATYDGDTPSAHRAPLRKNARLILTNPDMLHSGILPYHTGWAEFFGGLRYVVIDELHTYRGVFGSHVANVLRRLQRICAFYGSRPQFICTSATIANPQQLAQRLLEQPVQLIDRSGAPSGEKHVILYNPPIYDAERGLRRSATLEAQELAARTVLGGAQTILFGRSRLTTEVLLTYLRERLARTPGAATQPFTAESIRGYRGGYLPNERRAIEAGLRSGAVRAVVATNALELGIDIGDLQAVIVCGYPGSIAATWQQIGRAGRTIDTSLAIVVATSGVLDQFIMQHPEFIFAQSPEQAIIHPDNLMLLVDQVRCAAFEQPFVGDEAFGHSPFTGAVLDLLCEQGDVQRLGQADSARYFWNGDSYPAHHVSLRSAGNETVLIHAAADGRAPIIIGEIDQQSAPFLLHEGAIYIHEGRSHLVEQLDLEQKVARVSEVEVDYYTEATTETAIDLLEEHAHSIQQGAAVGYGELLVRSQVMSYRRIKRFTHETLGVAPLDYPPREWETSGYWLSVLPQTQEMLMRAGQWMDAPNDYGPNWQTQRSRVRARDGYRCTQCGAPEASDRQHDVHHLIPFRTFGYMAGLNENYIQANRLDNLALVCRNCHRRLESAVRTRGALDGLAYTLHNLAPLHLMCDRQDIDVAVERSRPPDLADESRTQQADASTLDELPTIYIYERATAGLGFSQRLYELHTDLLTQARVLIQACACAIGCPSCVGPVLENEQAQLETKQLTLALVNALLGEAMDVPVKPSSGLAVDIDF